MATGKCINLGNKCPNALSGKIIEADSTNFVCPECGKKLMPSKDAGGNSGSWLEKNKKKLAIAGATAVLGGGALGLYGLLQKDSASPTPLPDDGIVETPIHTPTSSTTVETVLGSGHVMEGNGGTGTISTEFGKYEGGLKDGKADGNGTFRFFKSCQISDKDNQERVAETGDYISGTFHDNKPVQVKWFGKDGTQKGTLIIGQTGL